MHQSTQNILQHISEREIDDSETDPSSNPLNRPIFAQRSSHSKVEQCKLANSSLYDSYGSTNSSSLIRKQPFTPLTSSQDHGYNSGASTALTQQETMQITGCSPGYNIQQIQKQHSLTYDTSSMARTDQDQSSLELTDQLNDMNLSTSKLANGDRDDQPLRLSSGFNDTRRFSSNSRKYNPNQQDQRLPLGSEGRFKASSCSTIYIDNSTISQPDLEQTIKCVSVAIYYHIKNRSSNEVCEIFDETVHPLRMPTYPPESTVNNQQSSFQNSSIPRPQQQEPKTEKLVILDDSDRIAEPDQEVIYNFVRTLFKAAQLTSEYAIITLVYLERLMTYAEMDLTPKTWRRMFLGAILLSSKVWEDQAIWNVDYAQILEEISVDDINELERQFLELIQFNMNVPSSVYAKYYFHLRTLAIENGITDEQTLMTTGQARDLEVSWLLP
jgi:hypothetical protein